MRSSSMRLHGEDAHLRFSSWSSNRSLEAWGFSPAFRAYQPSPLGFTSLPLEFLDRCFLAMVLMFTLYCDCFVV